MIHASLLSLVTSKQVATARVILSDATHPGRSTVLSVQANISSPDAESIGAILCQIANCWIESPTGLKWLHREVLPGLHVEPIEEDPLLVLTLSDSFISV